MPAWLDKLKKNSSVAQAPTLKPLFGHEEKEKRCPQCGEVQDKSDGYTNINAYCEKCREKNIREWKEKHPRFTA